MISEKKNHVVALSKNNVSGGSYLYPVNLKRLQMRLRKLTDFFKAYFHCYLDP